MKRNSLYLLILLSLSILLGSCKKGNDEEVKPFDPNTLIRKNGEVSGQFSGKRSDGTNFSYYFLWSNLEKGNFMDNGDGTYKIAFIRGGNSFYSNDEDLNLEIEFYINSLDPSQKNYTLEYNMNESDDFFSFEFMKDIGDNRLFDFSHTLNNGGSVSLTNISFDSKTGKFSANYTVFIPGEYNNTGYDASISNGIIDIALKRKIN